MFTLASLRILVSLASVPGQFSQVTGSWVILAMTLYPCFVWECYQARGLAGYEFTIRDSEATLSETLFAQA